MIVSDGDVTIDNLQGVTTIRSQNACSMSLHTVESAKLVIDAPRASVKMNLRSIHDVSQVLCDKAEIIVNDNFEKCKLFDH